MEPLGIKLVEQDKLFSLIFLPEPTRFQVEEHKTIDGVGRVYSIPVKQYYNPQNECYHWWGGVFNKAGTYRIRVEVTLITKKLFCGFRFHEPESLYRPNYMGDPRDESKKLRKEALAKSENILEIIQHYELLKQVIAGVTPLSSDFYNHLMRTLGIHDQYIEKQCIGIELPDFFSVDDYLFYYGRSKGLHLWDLVDAGLLSVEAAEHYSLLADTIDSAEEEQRLESLTQTKKTS